MLKDYGLTDNPFPITPQGFIHNWAGRQELKDDLIELIKGPRAKDIGVSEFAVLHGELGTGKSHALLYLKTKIQENTSNEFDSEVVYIERPMVASKTSFLELVRYIFHCLGQKKISHFSRTIYDKFNELVEKKSTELGFGQNYDTTPFFQKTLEDFCEEDQFMIRLLYHGKDDPEGLYSYFTSPTECPLSGVREKIDSDFIASKRLASFIRVLTQDFPDNTHILEAFYLFVDEFEIALEMKSNERDSLFSGFRELINEVPYRFCLLWSFSASAALIEAVIPRHLMKRMTRSFIEIPSLSEDEAYSFMISQIQSFHDSSYENPCHPFSEEALNFIIQHAESTTPRDLFIIARRVLERSIKREGLEPNEEISATMAERILQPYI